VLNLVGAFLSLSVAATIANGLVSTGLVTLTVVFAGLAGGIVWNLITWLFGIPSSSSHALIGGVIGSTVAAAGAHAVKWQGLVSKVIIPAVLSLFIAALVATAGTYLTYRIASSMREGSRRHGFRIGQVGSASLVSLAHRTHDAQKTMGIITLAVGRPDGHNQLLHRERCRRHSRNPGRHADPYHHLGWHLLAIAQHHGKQEEREFRMDGHRATVGGWITR